MIYTSYYGCKKNIDINNKCYVSISVSTPKWELPYHVWHCKLLKPFSVFGKYDNMIDYEREYRKILDGIGVEKIRKEFENIKKQSNKNDLVLLCYEKDIKECHRGVFAKWWYEKTGELVQEINSLNISLF